MNSEVELCEIFDLTPINIKSLKAYIDWLKTKTKHLTEEKRLTDLGTKVQRSIELLDATITVSIQTQNQEVLDTISRTAQSQYRLQETVEGLSIIAISYYALGILGYIAEGLHEVLPIDKPVLLTILAPIVVLVVFFSIRRLRRTIDNKR